MKKRDHRYDYLERDVGKFIDQYSMVVQDSTEMIQEYVLEQLACCEGTVERRPPKVDKGEWNVLSLVVDVKKPKGDARVILNGERACHLRPNSILASSSQLYESLFPDGSVDAASLQLDLQAGMQLGDEKAIMDWRSIDVCAVPWTKQYELQTYHTMRGVWRCAKCSCNNPGDATACKALGCGLVRPKSAPRPTSPLDGHPSHPGLLVVVADTFENLVINSDKDVFICVSADWCPPSKAMKPAWYELARLLGDAPHTAIAFLDCDANYTEKRYFFEGGIPNMKVFVRGKKTAPIPYQGACDVTSWLKFLEKETELDADALESARFQLYLQQHRVEAIWEDFIQAYLRSGCSSLVDFAVRFFSDPAELGAMHSDKKSEEEQHDLVISVTSDTFENVVIDNEKDVLVAFSKPWCTSCKVLAPEYKQLAADYAMDPNVSIVKIDGSKHEHKSADIKVYPQIKLYACGRKQAPIDAELEDGWDKARIAEFLESNRATSSSQGLTCSASQGLTCSVSGPTLGCESGCNDVAGKLPQESNGEMTSTKKKKSIWVLISR